MSGAVLAIGNPLSVSVMCGLAGSGALTLFSIARINSVVSGLWSRAVFGIGSICGMLLLSFMVGMPFALSARRLSGLNYALANGCRGIQHPEETLCRT